MTLAETQALFHALVTGRGEPAPGALEACFTGPPALLAARRVRIYADMWRARLLEALREEFPAVAACLGAARFEALGDAYLRAHPSAHHDIGRLGRSLAAFLRRHPEPRRPDLADLAALEWARSEVFFAGRAAPVGREALAALAPAEQPRARLRLVPALRLLALGHDPCGAWRRLTEGKKPGRRVPGPCRLAVWRAGDGPAVVHARLADEEGAALEAALAGAPLAEVCAPFAARQDAARAAFRAIGSWLDEGWVAGVATGPSPGGGAGRGRREPRASRPTAGGSPRRSRTARRARSPW